MQTTPKKILSISIALTLAVIVLGYGYSRAKDFLKGPTIEVTFPKNGRVFTTALIDIQGGSKNISFLNLNGRKIFTDENGNWHEKLLLSPGYNKTEITAKDRFGRDTTKTLEVVLREE